MPQGPVKVWLLGCNCAREASSLNPEKPSPNPFPDLVGFVSVSRFVSHLPSYRGGGWFEKRKADRSSPPFRLGFAEMMLLSRCHCPLLGSAGPEVRGRLPHVPAAFGLPREARGTESTDRACPALVITCPSPCPCHPGTSTLSSSGASRCCSFQCSSAASRLRFRLHFSSLSLSPLTGCLTVAIANAEPRRPSCRPRIASGKKTLGSNGSASGLVSGGSFSVLSDDSILGSKSGSLCSRKLPYSVLCILGFRVYSFHKAGSLPRW